MVLGGTSFVEGDKEDVMKHVYNIDPEDFALLGIPIPDVGGFPVPQAFMATTDVDIDSCDCRPPDTYAAAFYDRCHRTFKGAIVTGEKNHVTPEFEDIEHLLEYIYNYYRRAP